MDEMKKIGPRASFVKTKENLNIEIIQKGKLWQIAVLSIWQLIWTLIGIRFVISLLFRIETIERVIMAILVALWLVFYLRISKVWFWKILGLEIIKVSKGELSIRQKYLSFGKTKKYNLSHVKRFQEYKSDQQSYLEFFDNGLFSRGGDVYEFYYMSEKKKFGKQLSDKETRSLKLIINKALKEYSK